MAKEMLFSEDEAFQLLNRLHHILDGDPLIDEVGFIHPSQMLLMLNEEAGLAPSSCRGDVPQSMNDSLDSQSEVSELDAVDNHSAAFWHREHKLGISTQYLYPLYKAVKARFFSALSNYKMSYNIAEPRKDIGNEDEPSSIALPEVESEVMKHSKILLLLSSNFGTAWNARKLILTMNQLYLNFLDELQLSSLVLSFAPKTEYAWTHRRWVINCLASKCTNLQEILEKESKLVEKIAENSKMNYRAWNHRCWLVSYMSGQQVLNEFNDNRNWAGLHVSDNSCFHFRGRLMLRMLYDAKNKRDLAADSTKFMSLFSVWKEELDWVEVLIKRYIGREALWLHRRFLSAYWIKFNTANHFAPSRPSNMSSDDYLSTFFDNELQLFHHCLSLPTSEFDDAHAQTVHAAAYVLWLKKQPSGVSEIRLEEKLNTEYLRSLLNKLCPDRTMVWDVVLNVNN